jgi:hypothetical protein
MPSKNVLWQVDAKEFRALIRPALFGKIGVLEPIIADLCGDALEAWMHGVITATISETRLHDGKGRIAEELQTNARVFGRYSLNELRGQFYAYPWLFAHEFGAEIHPHSSQYLALPIYNALRPDGSPKYRDPKSWQRWGSFVYTQRTTGRKFLAYKDAGGELRILYILVDKVTIPARLGLSVHAEAMVEYLYAAWAQIFVEVASTSGFEVFWDTF